MSQPDDNGGTPRTDGQPPVSIYDPMGEQQDSTLVSRDFARQLELQLAASAARATKLEEALRNLYRDEKLDDDDPRLLATRHEVAALLQPSATGRGEG